MRIERRGQVAPLLRVVPDRVAALLTEPD
jgi:hypothetical protein